MSAWDLRLSEARRHDLDQRERGAGIRFELAEQILARDLEAAHRSDGGDVGDPAALRVQHLDLADQLAGAQLHRTARPLDLHGAFDDEAERVARLAAAHDRRAVRVVALDARSED